MYPPGPHRKRTVVAISSGSTRRPSGTLDASARGARPGCAGVFIGPGTTQFTLILCGPSSFARARVMPQSPCLPVERSEEHMSELQSRLHLVCRLLLEKI